MQWLATPFVFNSVCDTLYVDLQKQKRVCAWSVPEQLPFVLVNLAVELSETCGAGFSCRHGEIVLDVYIMHAFRHELQHYGAIFLYNSRKSRCIGVWQAPQAFLCTTQWCPSNFIRKIRVCESSIKQKLGGEKLVTTSEKKEPAGRAGEKYREI